MMRPLRLVYPADKQAAANPYQYLFGNDLLITPLVEPDSVDLEIYLPQGGWFSLWDDDYYQGGEKIKLTFSLDQIPVFVKGNSELPLNLGESCQLGSDVGNRTDSFQNLCFKIFPISNGDYLWKIDDQILVIALFWKMQSEDSFTLTVKELTRTATLLLPSGYRFLRENIGIQDPDVNRVLLDPGKDLQLHIQKLS